MNSIKNFVFDFGGVLVDLNRERCVESFRELGFAQAGDLVNNFCQEGVFRDLELGNISSEVFCQSVRHEAGKPVSDEQIIAAWNDMLGDIASVKLQKLLELRKEYNVYLLSNTNVIHWESSVVLFEEGGHRLEDYFNNVFLSFEMHQRKPNKEFFLSLATRVGILPHETLLIDDSEVNCEAACSLGWHALYVGADVDWISSL